MKLGQFVGSVGLVVAAFAALAQAPVPSQTSTAFAISKAGDRWAHIGQRPFHLEVRGRDQKVRVSLREMDAVGDVVPGPAIEWSAGGEYVSVVYRSEETASTLEVYDSKSLRRLLILPVADARWLKQGFEIVVVPVTGELGETKVLGLHVVDVRTGRTRVVARQRAFVGRLDAGDRFVIAQAVKSGSPEVTEFVRVDTVTGSTDE